MSSLFRELRRRNVFRVGIAYLVAAWLVLQIADLLVPILGLPDWAYGLVFLLLVIGLVPALIFAWAFELTPQGLMREKDVDRSQSITTRTGRKLDFAIIGLLSVALVYFIYESRIKSPPDEPPSPATQADRAETGDHLAVRSIAVLPFINIGGSADGDYLADGLAETLLHMLAQIDELQVAARTSAFKFKNTNEDVRIIGEQLGVATVLEGSIQRAGEQIRITAQLISVDDGFHLWSGNYDRKLEDIFAIQDEIATAVVSALQVALLGRLRGHAGEDAGAYDSLLRLRQQAFSGISEQQAEAVRGLKQLIDTNPDYAEAYATLSEAYIVNTFTTNPLPETAIENGIAAARKAIELDPDSSRAHVALSRALVRSQNYVAAQPITARALELQPGNADLMMDQVAILQSQRRFDEALDLAERAFRLDPLNGLAAASAAGANVETGAYERAVEVISGAVEAEPENMRLRMQLLTVYEEIGDNTAALPIAFAVLDAEPRYLGVRQSVFYMYFDMGAMETAEEHLRQVEAVSPDRGADERALVCFVRQDEECWRAATERMVANRPQQFFSQTWRSRMLYLDGHVDQAIEVMRRLVEYFDETDDQYGNEQSRINLGALYHFAGRLEERDATLDKTVDAVQSGIEHGWDSWLPYYYLGMAAAARGNVADAVRYLELAIERGFTMVWYVHQDYAWDPVRETAEFQSFMERLSAKNAATLAEIEANSAGNIP